MLELAYSRQEYLGRLLEGPAWKRDLIHDLNDSRSTVDRVVSSLSDMGLITKTESGYVTTYSGQLMLDAVREAAAVAKTAEKGAELLNHFGTDAPRNHQFLVGADIVSMEQDSPAMVLRRLSGLVRSADKIRGVAVTANNDGFTQMLLEDTLDEETLKSRFVITADVLRHLVESFPGRVDQLISSPRATVAVANDLPFAWYLLDDGETLTANLAVHGPYENFLGYISNDSPPAVEWLATLFDRVERSATPLAEYELQN